MKRMWAGALCPLACLVSLTALGERGVLFGDAEQGQLLYMAKCTACHSLDHSRIGPAHRGVYGRKAAQVAGFDYSAALRESHIIWNAKSLDRWLTNPEKLVPGQKMGYSVPAGKDRADIIAFLASPAAK